MAARLHLWCIGSCGGSIGKCSSSSSSSSSSCSSRHHSIEEYRRGCGSASPCVVVLAAAAAAPEAVPAPERNYYIGLHLDCKKNRLSKVFIAANRTFINREKVPISPPIAASNIEEQGSLKLTL